MEEQIYNLFLYVTEGKVTELGLCLYKAKGTRQEKVDFLRSKAREDHLNANRCFIPEMSYSDYLAQYEEGTHLSVFEPLFLIANNPENPVFCITPIIDGKPDL